MVAATSPKTSVKVRLPQPHPHQLAFIDHPAKRKVIRAGRRGGKTVGSAIMAVMTFLKGKRVLYAAPTGEQTDRFWFEVKQALAPLVQIGAFKQNESERFIEVPGTEKRIRAKTAWNADTLRGDYADLLILDEWQLTNEDAWEIVGAPMLLDNNGDAVFIYTPPSLRSAGVSKAHDPRHAAKMFKAAQADTTGRWAAFHFTSHDNPYISQEALSELMQDMSKASYRQEILAEDDELQLSWLVYRAFNEERCKRNREDIPKDWPIYTGHDFGTANPAALFVAQDPNTGQFYEFAEYLPGSGRSTAEHVEEFKRITEGYRVKDSWGGSHQEEEIRQGYRAHGWNIWESKWTKVSTQIDKTIGQMELNKIYIFNDMSHRIEELMNCLWEPDQEGRPTDKIKDEAKYHLCACARYLYCNFTPETVLSGPAPKAVSNH